MASAFDPSAFIAAEEREQSLATPASDFAFAPATPKRAENRHSRPAEDSTLAEVATLAGVPDETLPWSAELLRFTDRPCPEGIRDDYWDELTQESWSVSREWGRQALDLGWTSLDLFGCNPIPFPFGRRVDRDGLVMALVGLLTPVRIVEVTVATAVLRDRHSTMTFRRKPMLGAVHLWDAYAMRSGP